jgi:pyrroloquinoline quinone biosynthesis protein E
MKWDDCKRILSEASLMGVREVALSGGEPLLWTNLPLAVGYASASGMVVSLYSTGTTSNALASFENLKTLGLSRVIFSLFGQTKDSHEKITLVGGSFHSTMDSVRHCVSLDLHVEFHFVPMSANYEALRAVSEMARELGVKRVSVLRLVPQGRAANCANLNLNDHENRELRQLVIDLINEGHDIRLGSPYNILAMRENPECCSGIDRLTISPDLRISPCDAFKQISSTMIGVSEEYSSLADYSLSACWETSPYLRKIREYLTTPFAEECGRCNMLKKCLSGCLAQKFYAYGKLAKQRDPMCLCK